MQVNEVESAGLKRAYTVTVPSADIAAKRDQRLVALAKDLRVPGFRPGKVPMSIVKQRYGTAVLGEILEKQVGDASRQIVSDRGLKPALQPKIEITKYAEDADLEFRMDLEVLPDIPMPDFGAIALERLKAEPGEAEIDATLQNIAQRQRKLEDVAETRPAGKGDVLVCDFVGSAAEDGPAEGANLIPAADAQAAQPGALGTGEGWSVGAPDGVAWSVAGNGEDGGQGWIAIRFQGQAPAESQLTVRFAGGRTIPVTAGQALWLEVPQRLAAGNVPEASTALLVLGGNDAQGAYLDTAQVTIGAPTDASLAGQRPGAKLVAVPGAAFVQPGAALWLTKAVTVDLTLRIGTPKLTGVAVSWKEFPGGAATDMPIEVGGTGFIPGFTEQLDGMAPGEQVSLSRQAQS